MSSILTQASRQWASRPNDERFTSLTELNSYCVSQHALSTARVTSSRRLEVQPLEDNRGLIVLGANNGAPVTVSHWAFGQLAQRAGAPAGYLRDLPSPIAADCMNYGMRFTRDVEEIGLLTTQTDTVDPVVPHVLRAATGPNYGRVWNSTITKALVDRFGDGVTGDFRVPGEFGKAVQVTKANTTLYASDHDIFVFLADEKNRIEMPNRRDGHAGSLARGFFVWNSEVGAGSYGIGLFLFDYVCMNRIVWGAEGYQEIRGIHTKGAPDRWIEQIAPAIEAYANSSTAGVTQAIAAAQDKKVDDIDAFLKKRFTNAQVTGIKAAYMADEQRPIETVWDAVTGITAYARGISFQDERVKLEREAGKVMDLAA